MNTAGKGLRAAIVGLAATIFVMVVLFFAFVAPKLPSSSQKEYLNNVEKLQRIRSGPTTPVTPEQPKR